MSWDQFWWDLLLIFVGIFLGSAIIDGVISLVASDLAVFVGLSSLIPPVGPPLLALLIAHLLLLISMSVVMTGTVVIVLYAHL